MTIAAIIAFLRRLKPLEWLLVAMFVILVAMVIGYAFKDSILSFRKSKAEDRHIEAIDKAADKRAKQTIENEEIRRKLHEASKSLPDSYPSERRLASACQRLRLDGHTKLPAECGPAASSKATARP